MADGSPIFGFVPGKTLCAVCGHRKCFALVEQRLANLIDEQMRRGEMAAVTLICSERCYNMALNAKKGTVFPGGLVVT